MQISSTKIYWVWQAMLRRCYTPTNRDFKNYGARGINVCERWHSFPLFLQDMGEPSEGLTLERVDNNGNYELSNCRWATRKEQANNFRRNVLIERDGRTMNLRQWSDETGISNRVLSFRHKAGDRGAALFRPVIARKKPDRSSYPRMRRAAGATLQ